MTHAVVNLELEHEIGKIDDATYKSAFNLLQETLKRVNAQKSDMENTKTKVSNILLGDSPEIEHKTKTKITTEPKIAVEPAKEATEKEAPEKEAPELPEPPVVVYVKEVGKAGI